MSSSSPNHHFLKVIEYDEIVRATEGFKESFLIGVGSFGKVYKGCIRCGSESVVAAIKRLDPKLSLGGGEFLGEVNLLSNLRHPNIVSLYGYCHHEKEKFLVYEYMPNATLHDHLHKLGTHLSWCKRLKICIGVAFGLRYLHDGTHFDSGIVHGDVTSSHILLDTDWEAKISDIRGFLKGNQLSRSIKGTFGYLDPNYFVTGKIGRKSDVYAFGVLLLEVFCGKPVRSTSLYGEDMNLVKWVDVSVREGNLKRITDPDIRNEISPMSSKKFVRIATRCLQLEGKSRPTMAEVVADLLALLAAQEKRNGLSPVRQVQPSSIVVSSSSPKTFSQSCSSVEYPEIVKATEDFTDSLIIGRGRLGKIYKGSITCGANRVDVAIRCLNPEVIHEPKKFWAGVDMLTKVRHPDIVSLISYCEHEKGKFLVYEYMPNGPLDDHLHNRRTSLPLSQRLKICIAAARGLSYLHTCDFVHGDVSSSNILFDENWMVKVSADLRWLLQGNPPSTYDNTCVISKVGYLDPVYFETGKLRCKSDVYAFGVLMLEVLSRKPVLDEHFYGERMNLVMWAKGFINEGNLKVIPDSDIRDDISPKCLKKFVNIAMRCLDRDLKRRPTMAEVVANLGAVLASQEKFNGSKQGTFKSLLMAGTTLHLC